MIQSNHQVNTCTVNRDRSAPATPSLGGSARALVDAARAIQGARSLTSNRAPYPPYSRGTVLVVGLLILVVMMLLGLNSMQTSVLEEMMAGQSKQQNNAFHAAEAGMQAALSYLASLRKPPTVNKSGDQHIWPGCQVASPDSDCELIDPIIVSWRDFDPDATDAALDGKAMSVLTGVGWTMNETAVEPHFVIESRYVPDGGGEKRAKRKGSHFFTVTAVGFDPGTNSRAVLQSTITKLFP